MKNNLVNMKCLDFFVASQSQQNYDAIKHLLIPSNSIQLPILSFNFFIDNFSSEIQKLNRKNDINMVKHFAKKHKWENNVDEIFENERFEAIVITNSKQEILWVNNGFKKMTGYNKNDSLHKTPSFLQGTNTCQTTKSRIRKKLQKNEPFKEIVLNYKKDKTPYKCEIKVYPLSYLETTHYIALERAI
ncbi:PAS domain-containing protein [Polaribacter sp. WD7]|uniref:PAS domain-containing protein n=1 Tax=Polaribacter sp. WD7 TaxID=2269061 RepID=UPI000DF49DA5|nr:PAS domain-containing protein [Polaribacter sp. WD7]RCS27996.1 PAS domain-containing protein [Polaribacter sp. WD7]